MANIYVANLIDISHWIVDDNDESDQGRYEVVNRFHNGRVDVTVNFNQNSYKFLSFMYQGATRTRTGDNLEAGLVLSTNQLSMDYAYDIVMLDYNAQQHHIKRKVTVYTCLMTGDFKTVNKVLNTEYWIGASMNYDAETVEVTLSSAIDAVYAGLPNQYLTEKTVGRLPTTARVRTT